MHGVLSELMVVPLTLMLGPLCKGARSSIHLQLAHSTLDYTAHFQSISD